MKEMIIKNTSDRTFRWPEVLIEPGQTVKILESQFNRIPVMSKLIKSGVLELIGEQGKPSQSAQKEDKAINVAKSAKEPKENTVKTEEETEEDIMKKLNLK